MASVVDFSMLRQSPFEGALDPVADAVTRWSQRRHQRDQQEERLQFAREQEARLRERDNGIIAKNDRAADLNERRLVGERTTKNLGSRQAVEERIRQAVARQDFDEAERLGNSYTEQDAATGEVRTGKGALPGFDVKRPPAAPAALPALPQGVEYGPQATPEIASRAGKIRAEERSFDDPNAGPDSRYTSEATGEQQRFNQQQNSAPADPLVAEFQKKLEASKAPPQVTIGGVVADPEKLRYAAGRAQAQDFEQLGSVLQASLARAVEVGDPQAQAAAQRKLELFAELSPAVATGQIQGKDAANRIFGATTAEFKRDADLEQTNVKGGFAQTRADTAAAASAARGQVTAADKHGGMDPQAEQVKLSRIRLFNGEVEGMAKRHDLPADTRNLQRAIMNIDSAQSDNSVLQAAAQFGVARDITGGGGQSLSNKDVAMVAPRAGGIERLQGLAGRFVDGDPLSDAEKKVLADSIRHGMDFAKQRLGAFRDDYLATFDNDDLPWRQQLGRQHIMGALRRYIPQSESKQEGAPRAPRAGGVSRRPDPANPDDPNAPNAGRPLDGEDDTSTPEGRVRARARALGVDPDVAVKNLRAAGKL